MSTHTINSISTPIIHLIGPGTLKVNNGRLAYSTGQGTPMRLDLKTIQHIHCFGPVGMSDQAIVLLLKHNIPVCFLTSTGKTFCGSFQHLRQDTTLLRLNQYRASSDAKFQLGMAKFWVMEKITSQINATRHYQRQGKADGKYLVRLQATLEKIKTQTNIASLRGNEGETSALWFELFGKLFLLPWKFTTRNRRPPTDPVNALLSLGYTLLVSRTTALCQAEGLESMLGTLHEYRSGRPSLACDIMEPLRVPMVDRWVIMLCNQNQISPQDFYTDKKGVLLKREVFPKVVAFWEEYNYKNGFCDKLTGYIKHFSSCVRSFGQKER